MLNNPLFMTVAMILLLVGGINIGLSGLVDVNLILAILGRFLGRISEILIGASAAYVIYMTYVVKKRNP